MSKIFPINNSVSISSSVNSPLVKIKENQPRPIVDDGDIVIEVNSVGLPGPAGKQGNGIDRIEKTSTSGLVDTYTIFFTDGGKFEYQITNGEVHYYDGPYEVTPMVNTTQILPTANLFLSENVNVNQIPYYEVSNPSGGKTATIGDFNG